MKAFPSKNFIYFKDVKYLNLHLNSSISTYVNLGLDCFCVLGSVKPRATRKAEGGCEAWSSYYYLFSFLLFLYLFISCYKQRDGKISIPVII